MWPQTGLTGLMGQGPDSDRRTRRRERERERAGRGREGRESKLHTHALTWRDSVKYQLIICSVFEPLQLLSLPLSLSLSRSSASFTPCSPLCRAEWLLVKEIVSSNIQLLYAWHPGPTLNWFLTEREASLSTDTQPCFPHLPHPTQITPPSALPHRTVHSSPPFFPLYPSPLLCHHLLPVFSSLRSPRQASQLSAVGAGRGSLTVRLICL